MKTVYVKTLERAAEIAGGEQRLALLLKVTPSHLALWLRGIETPPTAIFLRAADLVSDHELFLLQYGAAARDADIAGSVRPKKCANG